MSSFYIQVSVHAQVHICGYLCLGMCESRVVVGVGCLGLSLNLQLAILAKLADQGALGSACLYKHLVP